MTNDLPANTALSALSFTRSHAVSGNTIRLVPHPTTGTLPFIEGPADLYTVSITTPITLDAILSLKGRLTLGNISLNAKSISIGGSYSNVNFTGTISGDGSVSVSSFIGSATYSAPQTYTGTTSVDGLATLTVNSTMAVGSGTTVGGNLRGTGTLQGSVLLSGGKVNPGSGTYGQLTVGQNLICNAGSLEFELNTSTPGTGHDQLIVSGDTIANGAQITLIPATPQLPVGRSFVLLQCGGGINNSNPLIMQNGQPLVEGSTFQLNQNRFAFTLAGGDGNDLAVTVLPPAMARFAITAFSAVPRTPPLTGRTIAVTATGGLGAAGYSMILESGPLDGPWQTVATATANASGVVSYTLPISTPPDKQFFRVRIP